MENFFQYGETEIAYLKQADKRLAEVIDRIGKVERRVIPDLFAALVHSIVGQQISTKAHETIWRRIENALGKVTPEAIDRLPVEELQGFGITFKKAAYIRNATRKVMDGTFDIQALYTMSNDEVCARLSELDGIGVWSAEMLMLFSMQRPDILSFGDLAIQRGLRMVYHHRKITRELFEKYRHRFSPYNSVASLYLWAVAGGAIEDGRLALRYICSNPDVTIVIPGMYSVDEARKNIEAVLDESPISEEEKAGFEAVRKELGENFCRRCNYCQPCSAGINISSVFLFAGYLQRYGLEEWAYDRYQSLSVKPEACVDCGACEDRCPYHLPIREMMRKCASDFADYEAGLKK